MSGTNEGDARSRTGTLPVRVHQLLLRLAGRVDDDALEDARSLLAVVEADRALVLTCGALAAEGVAVEEAELAELRDLVAVAGLESTVLTGLGTTGTQHPSGPSSLPEHQFTGGAAGEVDPRGEITDILRSAASTLPEARTVSCVWRTTPVATNDTPPPHRVVLIETAATPCPAVLAHRVTRTLQQQNVLAAVELLPEGTEVPAYHRAALAVARTVPLEGAPTTAEADRSTDSPAPSRPDADRDKLDNEPTATAEAWPWPTSADQEPYAPATESNDSPDDAAIFSLVGQTHTPPEDKSESVGWFHEPAAARTSSRHAAEHNSDVRPEVVAQSGSTRRSVHAQERTDTLTAIDTVNDET